MKILVLNCGSSSIKYKLFEMESKEVIAQGGIEKIGMKGSFLKLTLPDGQKVMLEGEILEHRAGIEYILGVLLSEKYGCIKTIDEIKAVGHRVVHGGERFNSSVLITDEVIDMLNECIELAPLHNPPNLKGIYAIQELLPGTPQVGVFDTAFHQTMPVYAYMYGLPYSLYEKYGIRRYGFHGTSHRYVSRRACEFLGVPYEDQRIITAHIGNGGSVTAIKNGKSIDTSMGMTPVEGLIMGTRSGDIDPGVISYIMEKENMGTKGISTLLNKFSGMLGISGVSSDMREIEEAIEGGNKRAIMALKTYCYRIKKYVGSYAAALGGVDILVFTGGVGENQASARKAVCENMEYMGIELDEELNDSVRAKEVVISKPTSKVKVLIIPTDEELTIAKDTVEILNQVN
ncbi:MAG TPA: acetate kinase [Fermentimonas caenicola]|jgi:acetate kinase|uniref:Acetate kinase n=1 Tax=Fermentimonas caenicola TaxID=1562970 RepID=A0A098BZ62_9BACT|nr:acetate kinase [Lascolabacillus sp.]MBP6175343.1 acetate kinase [Fermentimonas sp.]MDI9625954.1 acetate kinase [Bacteroidota bacterium]TAH61456.1 MAG: acetate kinase [Fermentimonas caenicola]MBP6196903.1 acetate kinase [Fermentimonas sp.]MBP7104177.1 acetate kinase [Fermentimonas sp.]